MIGTVLSCLEYEYKYAKQKTTKIAPSEVDVGRVRKTSFIRSLRPSGAQCEAAIQYIEWRTAFKAIIRDNIARASADQENYSKKKKKVVQ